MNERNFKNQQWIQLFFAVSIVLLSFVLSPGTSQDDRVEIFGIKIPVLCPSRAIFNKPCAGCGLTRSFVNFAHGNIEASYNYHKLGIPLFFLVLLQIPIRIYLLKTGSAGYTEFIKKLITYPAMACIIALLMNWIVFIFQSTFIPQ